jgi:hypothetical protein
MSGVTPFFRGGSYPLDFLSNHQFAITSSALLFGAVASLAAATPAAATPSPYDAPRIIHFSGVTSTDGYLTDLFRRAAYVNVHDAIETMAAIPAEEDYHIAKTTAEDAHFALSLLYIMGIVVPKVFSHDSESVTFSWARGSDRQYLTVSEGVASLLRTSSTKSEILEHASLHEPSIVGILKMAGEYGGGTEFVG